MIWTIHDGILRFLDARIGAETELAKYPQDIATDFRSRARPCRVEICLHDSV